MIAKHIFVDLDLAFSFMMSFRLHSYMSFPDCITSIRSISLNYLIVK